MKSLMTFGALLIASSAYGQTVTDSYSTWAANTSSINETSSFGASDFSTITGFNLVGGGSVTLTPGYPETVFSIGDGWSTWSGGYTGQVLVDGFTTVTFGSGVSALGFYVEPDDFASEDITVTLANGQSITEAVNGDGGASFFGYYGGPIASLTISNAAEDNFAVGEFFSGTSEAIPEPGSLALLLAGLTAVSVARRRRAT